MRDERWRASSNPSRPNSRKGAVLAFAAHQGFLNQLAIGLVAGEAFRPIEDCMRPIRVLMHAHLGLDEMGRSGLCGICRRRPWKATVLSFLTMRPLARTARPLRGSYRDKGRPWLGSRNGKAAVVVGQENVGDETIGRPQIDDAGKGELLRQAVCKVRNIRSLRPRACGE
jgi:hypothetical protein